MGYQSEAKLEDQLVKKLEGLQYTYKKIDDYEALEANFREQIQSSMLMCWKHLLLMLSFLESSTISVVKLFS